MDRRHCVLAGDLSAIGPVADRCPALLGRGYANGPLSKRPCVASTRAVVGLLLAAFYTPVWTSGIRSTQDFAIGLVAFLLLVFWKVPPWLVVVGSCLAGGVIYPLS